MIEGLKPLKLLPARERVASVIRKSILSKQIESGTILTLDETASSLGVSATPVREAFQMLSREGLIELKSNKGAVVCGITPKMLIDHYQIRAVLEAEACMACCRNKSDLSGIENALNQAKQALEEGNEKEYGNYNQSFHYEIWIASGNERLKVMLSELWNGLSMGVKNTVSDYAQKSIRDHSAIFDALKEQDELKCGSLMKEHIISSLKNILTNY